MVYVGRGACRDCSVYGRHSFQPIKLDLSPTTLRMNLAISKTGRCVTCNDNAFRIQALNGEAPNSECASAHSDTELPHRIWVDSK